MIHLIEYVGEPAVYEHLAEECIELAHAALKYARYLRGENPMNPNVGEGLLKFDLKEEATDVLFFLEEVGLDSPDDKIYCEKVKRAMGRLADANKVRNSS